jgi:hypothetical protein
MRSLRKKKNGLGTKSMSKILNAGKKDEAEKPLTVHEKRYSYGVTSKRRKK